jgi:oxidase EvaA
MAESPFDLLPRALEEFRGSIDIAVDLVPIRALRGWRANGGGIRDVRSQRFEVGGFRVHAPDREVPAWDQPLVRDLGEGEVVLAAQRRQGVLHFLLRPSLEVGFREKAQYGPSWQKPPEGRDHDLCEGALRDTASPGVDPAEVAPADPPEMVIADPAGEALATLLSGPEATERLACLQSEEGGRFYRSASRYRLVELAEDADPPLPRGARFATLSQIRRLLAAPGMLTNEARSAVALLLTWLPGPRSAIS